MQRFFTIGLGLMLVFGMVNFSQAHFGIILPEKSMVMQEDKPELEVTLAFLHPFEQKGMNLVKPRRSGVQSGKSNTDLLNTLQETQVLGKQGWKGVYTIKGRAFTPFTLIPNPTGSRRKKNLSSTRPRLIWPPWAVKRIGTRKWASRPRSFP